MEKHVVVIFPHPDDETFGTAGTIAGFRKQGVPVTYLCGTSGELGRNMGLPMVANRETLPQIRKKELQNACRVLDCELQMLGYFDKTIEFEDRNEVAAHVQGILEEIKPSLVITHYPGYAIHPDHNALGAATIEAVRMMNKQDRPKLWVQAINNNDMFTGEIGKPDVENDITPFIDVKLEAIQAHESQAKGVLGYHKQEQEKDWMETAKRSMAVESFYLWEFTD
jgi:bacillithiol biosynthesis deacetylase BshB2